MKVTFHGAAREVTGSCHLVEAGGRKILLDCGMIQGGKEREARNREPFPFAASDLDLVVLSHAHIDHSGRLPLLMKGGYRGPILMTKPTEALLHILLSDSGRIHEEDARWKRKRLIKAGKDASHIEPLFTAEEGLAVLEQAVSIDFEEPYAVPGGGEVRFTKAGHILGAGIVQLQVQEGDRTRNIVFSGDLGVRGSRLLSAPKPVCCPDYLLMESTYGDRRRDNVSDRSESLLQIIQRTFARGGKLIIPSFAVGRTQEILARINDLVESGRLKGVPVFVDSPMAVRATHVFGEFPNAYSQKAYDLLKAGDEPLEFPGLKLVTAVEESMALNTMQEPCVIISASGMCTAGRIKHHLKHNISDPRATILFVGYQARETLGQIIKRGTTPIRIFGQWYDVRAEIAEIEGFSAHADQEELLEWFDSLDGRPRRTFLVHGEESAALNLAGLLERRFGVDVEVPNMDQSFELD